MIYLPPIQVFHHQIQNFPLLSPIIIINHLIVLIYVYQTKPLIHLNVSHVLILYPRYLLQTINYKWNILTDINNYIEWKILNENLKTNFIGKFYTNIFTYMSFWWSSELFSTYSIMEQLEQGKYVSTGIKFAIILIFLVLFTGVLGIFVTLTTLFNFLTCMATLTLFNYKLTVENMSYFTIGLIICSQYSVLYSIGYV